MEVGNQRMATHSNRHEFYFPSANQTFPDESKSGSRYPDSQSYFLTIPDRISGSSCYLDADREEPLNNPLDMSEPLRDILSDSGFRADSRSVLRFDRKSSWNEESLLNVDDY